jgi:hypothetical protein
VPLDYEELVRRGVSRPVARFTTAKQHPIENFDIFVRPVSETWDYNVPPDAREVVGLWDQNADAYARWVRNGATEFVLLHHDDPDYTLVAGTEQGLLAELARQYFEFLDWHDEAEAGRRFTAFTEYIGFRHGAALEQYLVADSDTADFHAEFRSLFGHLA